jgi:acetyl-CoA synthetase
MITPLAWYDDDQAGFSDARVPRRQGGDQDERGDSLPTGGGLLTLTRPWPSMLRGIYGDPDRYVKQYWSKWTPDVYFAGDGRSSMRTDSSGCSGAWMTC